MWVAFLALLVALGGFWDAIVEALTTAVGAAMVVPMTAIGEHVAVPLYQTLLLAA